MRSLCVGTQHENNAKLFRFRVDGGFAPLEEAVHAHQNLERLIQAHQHKSEKRSHTFGVQRGAIRSSDKFVTRRRGSAGHIERRPKLTKL